MSESMSVLPCAVIGTGAMGSALARALLAAGTAVSVWNRSPERAAPLAEDGAVVAESVAAAIASAEMVVVCVAHPGVTRGLFEDAAAAEALRGRTVIEFSVGDPEVRIALEDKLAGHGARYLAAAVKAYPREVGTPDATLHFYGDSNAFDDARPTLDALGNLRYLGADIRREEALQVATVTLTNILAVGLFEVAAYVAANGVELSKLLERLPSVNRIVAAAGAHAAARDESSGAAHETVEASIETWRASLEPLVAAARAAGTEPRVAASSLETFDAAIEAGLGGRDIDSLRRLHPGAAAQLA